MENFGLGLVLNFQDNATSGMGTVVHSFEALINSMKDLEANSLTSAEGVNALASSFGILGVASAGLGAALVAPFIGLGSAVLKTGDEYEKTRMTLQALYKDADVAKAKLDWAMNFAAATPFSMGDLVPALTKLKAIGVEADKDMTSMDGYSQKLLAYMGDLAALRPDKGMGVVINEVREYLEGLSRPLKMSFGMSSKEMLGEGMAGSKEGRMQQFVDMVSKLNASGLMNQLNGTWTHMISNIGDQWDRLKLAISDAGFFQSMKANLKTVFDAVSNLTSDEVKKVGQVMSSVLEIIAAPIGLAAKGFAEFVKWLVMMAKEHPNILGTGLAIIAVTGAVLILGGVLMIATAAFFKLKAIMMSVGTGTTLLGSMFNLLKRQVWAVAGAFLPLAAASALIYFVWSTNMFGIRNHTLKAMKDIVKIFEIVSDAWDGTLSRKNYDAAKEMGILGLISDLLMIKYYAEIFFDGLKEGFENGCKYVKSLSDKFDEMGLPVGNITKKVQKFFDMFTNPGNDDSFKEMGKTLGNWLPIILGVYGAFKLLSIGWGMLAPILSVVWTIFSSICVVIGTIAGVSAVVVGAVIIAIVGLALLIYTYWDEICSFVTAVWGGIAEACSSAIDSMGQSIDDILNWFSNNFEYMGNVASTIWTSITDTVSGAITGMGNFILSLGNDVSNGFQYVCDVIKNFFTEVCDWASDKLSNIVDFLKPIQNGFSSLASFVGGGIEIKSIPSGEETATMATGGYVPDEGLVHLHPNEIVVNSPLTNKLRDLVEGASAPNAAGGNNVTFSEGSIVIQVQNANSQQEVEDLADKLMQIIGRKTQLNAMATRA